MGFYHSFGLFVNVRLFLHYVCGLLVKVRLVLHYVCGPLVSVKLTLYYIFRPLINVRNFLYYVYEPLVSMELSLHHIFRSLVSVELEILHRVYGLLVSVGYGFSIVDLLACANLKFWLFSFNIFYFSAIGTSTYQFFYRNRLFSFKVNGFLAFVTSTRQTFWLIFFIIVFEREALKCWLVFIIVRKLGQSLCLVIFKDSKIFIQMTLFWSLM